MNDAHYGGTGTGGESRNTLFNETMPSFLVYRINLIHEIELRKSKSSEVKTTETVRHRHCNFPVAFSVASRPSE